ncbi:hypothetical protein MTO96_023025 [Rhipicephalus appendiculatus]
MAAFKVAFDDLEECPCLKAVYFHVDCEGEDIGTTLSAAFRSLHTLDLRCENTGTGFARDVADYIRQNRSLRNVVLRNSCGGDEGAAVLIEALAVNDTLKRFSLADMDLSSDTLTGFTEMLATNSALEVVNLKDVCPVEKGKVCRLLAQEWHARVFKRLDIVWPEQLLPELKVLMREKMRAISYCPLASPLWSTKGLLCELLHAVAVHKTLQGLRFAAVGSLYTFDALAEGIATLIKRTRTLQQIENFKHVIGGEEHHLLVVLDALKRNSSIKQFTMYIEMVTPEIAASLSELFEVNNTLTAVDVSGFGCEISSNEVETILRGLRTNYTLTELEVSDQPDEPKELSEVEEILARNVLLKNQAAEFVISGGHTSDEEGANALKKVRSSAGLVERVRELTGETTEVVLEEIQSILARLKL